MNKGAKGNADLISIILPVYNGEKFLAQSIKSCLSQTYINFELFIVNDCSTDNTLQIAKNFAREDSRIKIVSNSENKKLPASLNVGHKLAQGNFITWTSHDNFFEPEALKVMHEHIKNSGADIVFSNFNIVEEDGTLRRNIILGKNKSLILGNTMGACFLYTKMVFERNFGYDEELHAVEDYDFWLQALRHSKFHHVPATLYNFRSHGKSLSSNLDQKDLNFDKKLRKSYSKFFQKIDFQHGQKYSQLFVNLHRHYEIDVNNLFNNYSELNGIISNIYDLLGKKESKVLQKEIDLKVRDNIDNFPVNQNLKTLLKVVSRRPQVLLNYDRKRTFRIIKKCFRISKN